LIAPPGFGGAPRWHRLMEFNALTFTKQDSILIAVTLAIMLSLPVVVVPAFYGLSTVTLPDHAVDHLGSRESGASCSRSSGFLI
jgi:hypothetical protein